MLNLKEKLNFNLNKKVVVAGVVSVILGITGGALIVNNYDELNYNLFIKKDLTKSLEQIEKLCLTDKFNEAIAELKIMKNKAKSQYESDLIDVYIWVLEYKQLELKFQNTKDILDEMNSYNNKKGNLRVLDKLLKTHREHESNYFKFLTKDFHNLIKSIDSTENYSDAFIYNNNRPYYEYYIKNIKIYSKIPYQYFYKNILKTDYKTSIKNLEFIKEKMNQDKNLKFKIPTDDWKLKIGHLLLVDNIIELPLNSDVQKSTKVLTNYLDLLEVLGNNISDSNYEKNFYSMISDIISIHKDLVLDLSTLNANSLSTHSNYMNPNIVSMVINNNEEILKQALETNNAYTVFENLMAKRMVILAYLMSELKKATLTEGYIEYNKKFTILQDKINLLKFGNINNNTHKQSKLNSTPADLKPFHALTKMVEEAEHTTTDGSMPFDVIDEFQKEIAKLEKKALNENQKQILTLHKIPLQQYSRMFRLSGDLKNRGDGEAGDLEVVKKHEHLIKKYAINPFKAMFPSDGDKLKNEMNIEALIGNGNIYKEVAFREFGKIISKAKNGEDVSQDIQNLKQAFRM